MLPIKISFFPGIDKKLEIDTQCHLLKSFANISHLGLQYLGLTIFELIYHPFGLGVSKILFNIHVFNWPLPKGFHRIIFTRRYLSLTFSAFHSLFIKTTFSFLGLRYYFAT